jgi:hypothetical protein
MVLTLPYLGAAGGKTVMGSPPMAAIPLLVDV